jgi:BMFP domain-containing protein YqiC
MQAEQERDSRIAQLEASLAERTTERDTHATTIGEYEQTIERQEAALAAHRADAVQMKDEFEATTALLTRAREKWSQDSDALQSAEAALSMALEAIGQAQKREMP